MFTTRPDKPLIVKCTFDRWNKKITFSSARNCNYDLLKHKVEQCFSLYSTSYSIAYKDDDGEVTDITTENDLTEAIHYFQAGTDDPPMSSAASILSGRSFGSRKITLRVDITVDYDGPSLSDTSSLASLEEYKNRNGSQQSFSFGTPSIDLDDDSVTVSSRDTGAIPPSRFEPQRSRMSEPPSSIALSDDNHTPQIPSATPAVHSDWDKSSVAASSEHQGSASRLRDSAVFERLKLQESTNISVHSAHPLAANDRGAAWLRDQNERAIRSMLGALPEPSESDSLSISRGSESLHDLDQEEEMGRGLALQQGPHGKFYYSYTSGESSGTSQAAPDEIQSPTSEVAQPRPTSMHINWVASHQATVPRTANSFPSTAARSIIQSHNSDPLPASSYPYVDAQTPPEVLQYLPIPNPPKDELTACSECGIILDSFRYVCSTCGERKPVRKRDSTGEGKASSIESNYYQNSHVYPPNRLTFTSNSSHTLVGSSGSSTASSEYKPLPSIPPKEYGAMSFVSPRVGYELCSGCIESAGVIHAIEAGIAPGASSPVGSNLSPTSPEDAQRALSQWRRTAPTQKGQLRHAYRELQWGHSGWTDVEQDDIEKCSMCNAVNFGRRYKCALCNPSLNLCRACYGQVHELHPSHAFLLVPNKPSRSDEFPSRVPGPDEERSLLHPDVKCAHCDLDIVGARFHCAICNHIDICSNCEAVGLPGNLDSSDGGHDSSHIMIKIPYPLETNEVETASRRALHLWTGRDSLLIAPPPKASSVISSYARTIIGSKASEHNLHEDHNLNCGGCRKPIIGVRYQCANCPSAPVPYSLCATCEARSYIVHDPMHIFFKFPRPLERPLELPRPLLPLLYKTPVGPSVGNYYPTNDPKGYLQTVLHTSAICDRCMTRIQGIWFRCAYCAKDLCDACEELDTHNDSHAFLVCKSAVDMQIFKRFGDIENPNGCRPLIPFPVYD